LGSAGSTLVAAAKHGRTAIGGDIMPEYVEITLDRLNRLAAGTLKMRPIGKPVARAPMSGAPDSDDLSHQIEMF
jgi:adenine-specific DNA-methyltransferase